MKKVFIVTIPTNTQNNTHAHIEKTEVCGLEFIIAPESHYILQIGFPRRNRQTMATSGSAAAAMSF